jgi:hypothetical protein
MNKEPSAWYHGSPLRLARLRSGSTLTHDRRLAEVFSHKPTLVSVGDDGMVRHNGYAQGWLYAVSEDVRPEDVTPHPRSSMQPGQEWLTRRELSVALLGPVPITKDEILLEEEIQELSRRMRSPA